MRTPDLELQLLVDQRDPEWPTVVVDVTILSLAYRVENIGYMFLVRRLPDTHPYAPRKLDLITKEERVSGSTLIGASPQERKDVLLGTHRAVAFYEARGEYRDTRRVFWGMATDDASLLKNISPEGFSLYSEGELRDMDVSEFRRPVILQALLAHAALLRCENTPTFDLCEYPAEDHHVQSHLTTHPWSFQGAIYDSI